MTFQMIARSTITCPNCGTSKIETMPTHACQFFTTAQAVERFCAQSPAIAAYFVPLETFHVRQFRKRSKRMVVARRQSTLQGTLDWHWGCGPARHSRESNGALTGASGEYLTGQPFVQCITMPATAPMNNKMQAVDWMTPSRTPGESWSNQAEDRSDTAVESIMARSCTAASSNSRGRDD
jgi:hypothetical protein